MKHTLGHATVIEYDFALRGRGKCPHSAATSLESPAMDAESLHKFQGVAICEGVEIGWTREGELPTWTAYFRVIPRI